MTENLGLHELPAAWQREVERILTAEAGVFLLVGGPDTGKTTFFKALARQASKHPGGRQTGLVDADSGQSTIGPPTSIGLSVVLGNGDKGSRSKAAGETTGGGARRSAGKLPREARASARIDGLYFIGDNSPRGHLLETVVGTRLMVDRAFALGCRRVVIDSSGMISHPLGEVLKYFKIDLIRPTQVVAFERERELDRILLPLSARRGLTVRRLGVPKEVSTVSREARTDLRMASYRHYFAGARTVSVPVSVSTYPASIVWESVEWRNLLVGLQDPAWDTLAIATLLSVNEKSIKLLAPLPSGVVVKGMVVGNLRVTPDGHEVGRLKPWELSGGPASGAVVSRGLH